MTDDYKKRFEELITLAAKEKASDLHLSVGRHPTLRISGELTALVKYPVLTAADTEGMIFSILTSEEKSEFLKQKTFDFSYAYEDKARFRVNIFFQRGFISASFRLIPVEVLGLSDLNLPPILADFARKEQGFFLVVGPTGHGKSTTLASMIDIINRERAEHIITVEDPIEYLFTQDKSIIDQREIGRDAMNFASALRSMFREDINVAMIGEMRDPETISAAVTAAETGHLVLSSLHTNSASQTIDRIIDTFAPGQQNQIRTQLAGSLLGIFSQRLVPRVSGGRIPAYELLIANTPVRNLIRENKIHEIDLYIETSSEAGMISLNQSFIDLVQKGEVTMETARAYSLNAHGLENLMR
ncbi:MAG: type IV pilus twitching motility protein PilT [Candidatus Niyogibacteria bacterium]|nr:MAG: type IV pilus twitching motility protein PilT [Candidatus Niyogibacteria bacterium]